MTFRHHLEQNAHETWVVYRNWWPASW